MAKGPDVLVLDDYSETVDVLRAVLEPRGVRVEQATAIRKGACAAGESLDQSLTPAVVVVDADTAVVRGVCPQSWPGVPRVLIESFPLSHSGDQVVAGICDRRLCKPFHYADLIREIELLVALKAA